MASGFSVAGLGDFDSIFQPGSRAGPNTGLSIGGSDLINRYAQWDATPGNQAPATGFYNSIVGGDLNIWFQKLTSASVVNPISSGSSVLREVITPSIAQAIISVETNGLVNLVTGADGNWYQPLTAGIGNTHWVKFTQNSGTAVTGVALNVYHQLTSNRQIVLSAGPAISARVANVNVYVSNNGTDGGIVAQLTGISMTALCSTDA
jgi:hypothetical protein